MTREIFSQPLSLSIRRGSVGRRAVLHGLLAVGCITGIGFAPSSCQSGGIGDPCTPEDEYLGTFPGFQVTQENIESRSFQCESRICLVNHFQGRVSCPLGQPKKTACSGIGDSCGDDGECTLSATFANDCTADTADVDCNGGACNAEGFCECSGEGRGNCPAFDDATTPEEEGYLCNPDTKRCELHVCHIKDNCQDPTKTAFADNDGKDCCIPGTDTPVATEVCSQCGAAGLRDAANAVFCSCRCGVAEGQEEDENFNFCDCPDGFQCAEVRPDVGLGDKQLTGKYCVRNGDQVVVEGKVVVEEAAPLCGDILGQKGEECQGTKVIAAE